jgi:hypothetical protein
MLPSPAGFGWRGFLFHLSDTALAGYRSIRSRPRVSDVDRTVRGAYGGNRPVVTDLGSSVHNSPGFSVHGFSISGRNILRVVLLECWPEALGFASDIRNLWMICWPE